jgi:rsbT co-antagonist protein RsbR
MIQEGDPDGPILRQQLEALRTEAEAAKRRAAQARASYQQHALNMELIRQQNEELDRMTRELARARDADEARLQQLERLNQQLSARELENQRLIKQLEIAVEQLSTPVLQLWRDVLALPLVGSIDEERAATILERLLGMVAQQRARHVIIDVTGTETVDTATAAHLLRISQAVRLLGARCILCGLRPDVAQAMTMLGVSLHELRSSRNLHTALASILDAQL